MRGSSAPRLCISHLQAATSPVSRRRHASSSTSSTPPSCSSSSRLSSSPSSLPPIRYRTFREPLPYPVGLKLQSDIVDYRLKLKGKGQGGGKQDVVLFLEHTPTYTTGRRDNTPNPEELHPEERKVIGKGASFFITKRGGQVTYHGPGQLVGYPILDLNNMELSTRCYVDYVQSLLAEYVRERGCEGILAPHPEGHVGVFASPTEKVASIGIHLSHRITSHGFAMNITPAPIKWFDLIMACGLADVHAVSLHDLIRRSGSAQLPSVQDVAEGLVPGFAAQLQRPLIPLNSEGAGGQQVEEEVVKLREMCDEAEEMARRENERSGGWRDEPDLTAGGGPEQL